MKDKDDKKEQKVLTLDDIQEFESPEPIVSDDDDDDYEETDSD